MFKLIVAVLAAIITIAVLPSELNALLITPHAPAIAHC